MLGRKPNWKSPVPGLVQRFWLKNFSSLLERVRLQLKECLDSGFVPSWLTRRKSSKERLNCYGKIRVQGRFQKKKYLVQI